MHRFILTNNQLNFDKGFFVPDKKLKFQIENVIKLKFFEKFIIVFNDTEYICTYKNDVIKIIEKIENKDTKKNKKEIVLIQAIPKANKLDLILQKATEIGVSEIYLWLSERSISRYSKEVFLQKKERFERILKEAAEQSNKIVIPKIHFLETIKEFKGTSNDLNILLFENEKNKSLKESFKNINFSNRIIFIVGPEGGISNSEVKQWEEKGFKPTTLGQSILRTETSSMYVLSIIDFLLS